MVKGQTMMRYVLVSAATILAACTFPPVEKTPDPKPAPVSPTIEIAAPREVPKEIPAPKPKPLLPLCNDIATGDPKEDVRAKLDCLKENASK